MSVAAVRVYRVVSGHELGRAVTVTVIQYELIRQLARDGLGYEDIGVRLSLPWRDVRPIVIRGKDDNQRESRSVQTAPDRH